MDGRTVQRMRLLERSNNELATENTALSAKLLQMSEQHDKAVRQSHLDRLLTAVLVRAMGRDEDGAQVVHVAIPDVDQLRAEMATAPGLAIHTQKDLELGIWVIELRPNPEAAKVIHNCSACGKDHVDVQTREVTEEERARGVLWVAICPEKSAEVFAIEAKPDTAPPERRLIEVVR